MAGKKTENTKKVSGNAKKAEAAALKAEAENAKKAQEEDKEWSKGAKSNAKKEAELEKKTEQARKKAEKDAILAEEEKDARATPKNSKTAVKKTKGLDISQLDDEGGKGDTKSPSALNATGIDNALDALSVTAGAQTKIDKHPERRFKAALAAFEERRLKEMDEDGSGQGLRQNQKRDKIKKEFEKSEENPFNQVSARYDSTKDELKELREQEKAKIEKSSSLKYACPHGIFMTLTSGDPTLWSGVMFIRKGPYAPSILRFQISFPPSYPSLPPLVTFSTDMFHPLLTPLTTYMYTTDIQDGGTVSATDEERLPPGGYSLRHGFPGWFGRGRRSRFSGRDGSNSGTPIKDHDGSEQTTPDTASPTPGRTTGFGDIEKGKEKITIFEVLRYIRSTFDDDEVLDQVPLEAAGNPGAWHAWRTHRVKTGRIAVDWHDGLEGDKEGKKEVQARKPGEWNWDGVWEVRVKKGIEGSVSEQVLFGKEAVGDDLIRFLEMKGGEIDTAKENMLRSVEVKEPQRRGLV
ncbi:hypothetical protein B7494_g4851 [Chlorociboria aeruginascens]|nr:hypothetical protein B7494_g4851 [Chlorociboria aeruginascens]